ncbi:MAG: DUF6263 family protein [Chitinophagaceae bacterium]
MKYFSLLVACICFSNLILAQEHATEITLQPGQKITIKSFDSTALIQKQGDEENPMLTISEMTLSNEVLTTKENIYSIQQVLQKAKILFEGWGQKMDYDSEDKNKQSSPIAQQFKDKIGMSEEAKITTQGKFADKENNDSEKKQKGMMRMMSKMSGANLENAFLLIPSEVVVGKGWKVDNSKDDIKSQVIYFLDELNGNIAKVSFKRKTKGVTVSEMNGMSMNTELDNMSEGDITVDITTGLVKTFNETTQLKSITKMMDKEIPSSGVLVSRVIFE